MSKGIQLDMTEWKLVAVRQGIPKVRVAIHPKDQERWIAMTVDERVVSEGNTPDAALEALREALGVQEVKLVDQ